MSLKAVVPLYRLGFSLVAIAAMVTQLVSLAGAGTLDAGHYLTYFTIDSNLIATILLLVGAVRWRSPRSALLDLFRGGAVAYMIVTGVVFAVLLSGTNVDTAIPWVNSVVHEVMPIVVVADWLLDPPDQRLSFKQGSLWLIFPAAWIALEMIRGAITGKYHYPFTNPANGGYTSVLLTALAILVFMLIVCAVVVWLGNVRRQTPTAIQTN